MKHFSGPQGNLWVNEGKEHRNNAVETTTLSGESTNTRGLTKLRGVALRSMLQEDEVDETNIDLEMERNAGKDYPQSGAEATIVCVWICALDRTIGVDDRSGG